MKRLIYIGITSFLLIGAWSCSKGYLDQVPQDRTTIQQVFAHKQSVDQYLANVNSYVRDESGQRSDINLNNNDSRVGGPWTGASDEADFDWSFVFSNYMNVGSWDPTTPFVNYFWSDYYTAIRSATYFMAHVGECKEITSQAAGADALARYIAEARALRAFYYYNLVKIYGPVVIIGDKEIAPDASLSAMQLARSPYDSCINYISAEFDKAALDLPDVPANPAADKGRMTRSVVMAYKSEMLLTAASDLFNGNSDYASLKSSEGNQLINQQKDATKWAKAAAASKAFLDKYVPGTFDLYKELDASGNIDPYLSCRDVMYNEGTNNKEWIFALVGAGITGRQYEETPYHSGSDASVRGSGGLGATQTMVDAYFTANGLPITDGNSGYVETGFSSAAGKYTKSGTYNMYCNREPRFYVGITYSGSTWLNTNSGSGAITTQLYFTGNSGKKVGGNDYSPTGFIVRKNCTIGDWNAGNRSWVLLRLANIYLNYAEALNESDPGNADIAKYVNLIRARAGVPNLVEGLSQTQMRTAIRAERRVELAFENVRYFDTRRWKIAEQTDGGVFYGMDINSGNSLTDVNFYKRTPFETRVFQKKNYLWPIPQQEINIDKNLLQNTGW